MGDTTRYEIFHELLQLEGNYWYDIDRCHGASAQDFYIEGGRFVVGDQVMTGRSEIAAFYRWRSGLGPRVARHSISNPRLTSVAEREAVFECILHLYADDGV